MSDQETEHDCFECCQADVGGHGVLFPKCSTQLRVEVSTGRQDWCVTPLERGTTLGKMITGAHGG